jgi:hypothetical protein
LAAADLATAAAAAASGHVTWSADLYTLVVGSCDPFGQFSLFLWAG